MRDIPVLGKKSNPWVSYLAMRPANTKDSERFIYDDGHFITWYQSKFGDDRLVWKE